MKAIYFIIGVLIPLPVFFNLLNGEILVQKASLDTYLTGFGAPVPIGTGAVILLGLLSLVLNRKRVKYGVNKNIELIISLVLGACFLFIAVQTIDILRVVSLVFPFAAIIFVYLYSRTEALFLYSMKGYMFSIFLLVITHAFSITLFEESGVENKILLFSSFYGYSIYQSLISYSAVLSFFGCTLVILFTQSDKWGERLWYLVIAILIFYILGYGARKAVLLDLFSVFLAYFMFGFVSVLINLRIHKSMIRSVLFLGGIIFYLVYYSGFAERSLSYDVAVAQRGGAYEEFFLAMANSSFFEFIFGQGGGWGGYSNIFIELLLRLGVFGILLFLISLMLLIKYVGSHFLDYFVIDGRYGSYHFKVWLAFFMLSLVSSNTVNMNLQLPYYVLNIAFISLAFLHLTRKKSVARNVQVCRNYSI